MVKLKIFRSPIMRQVLIFVAAMTLVAGCSSEEPKRSRRNRGPGTQLPQEALHPNLTVPHGDHTPHKGGTVMMYGDLHYEVILDRLGKYELWLSDELRTELPASNVEAVTFTVRTASGDGEFEVIALERDEEDTKWFEINDSQTIARIGFEYDTERYWIDLMFPQAQFGTPAETDAPDSPDDENRESSPDEPGELSSSPIDTLTTESQA